MRRLAPVAVALTGAVVLGAVLAPSPGDDAVDRVQLRTLPPAAPVVTLSPTQEFPELVTSTTLSIDNPRPRPTTTTSPATSTTTAPCEVVHGQHEAGWYDACAPAPGDPPPCETVFYEDEGARLETCAATGGADGAEPPGPSEGS